MTLLTAFRGHADIGKPRMAMVGTQCCLILKLYWTCFQVASEVLSETLRFGLGSGEASLLPYSVDKVSLTPAPIKGRVEIPLTVNKICKGSVQEARHWRPLFLSVAVTHVTLRLGTTN